MKVKGKAYTTIWVKEGDQRVIQVIDQRFLPHNFVIEDLKTLEDTVIAIKEMHVRGAGLIGAAAGFGMYLAALKAPQKDFDEAMQRAGQKLVSTRPTAVNLFWAVERQLKAIKKGKTSLEKTEIAFNTAKQIAKEDACFCKRIGEAGVKLIEEISKEKKGETLNILTHCNAGWLAFVDFGSATAPIYEAFRKGIKIHVWVDETRPRNQGARLTAFELGEQGVPYTVIADNTGGHLMQQGLVDLVIVGSDRTTLNGDVANKIGTYLKALAAKDNNVPFYVALPSSSIDWKIKNGLKEIPIEQRGGEEVQFAQGLCEGEIKKVLLTPKNSSVANYAFDVTPSRLITGLITERGICKAEEKEILKLFPERKPGETEKKDYIKFDCEWKKTNPFEFEEFEEINKWRSKFFELGIIGSNKKDTGFGNISVRIEQSREFIVTGSATGMQSSLTKAHFAKVTGFNFNKNMLKCEGAVKASSESLTHAAVYCSDNKVGAVIHVHSNSLWKKLVNSVPTTNKSAEYGSPEMIKEIIRLFQKGKVKEKKIIAMGGHKDGVICFGENLHEAGTILLDNFKITETK